MRYVFFALLLGMTCIIWGQSNNYLDTILSSKTCTYGQAAYLVASANSLVSVDLDEKASVAFLAAKGYGLKKAATDQINYGELSYLVMKGFSIPSGLMFTLFPGPRYALREMLAHKLLPGSPALDAKPRGEDVVRIISSASEWKETE